ncbi:hypothetical protein ISS05_04480 [Candidatus Woesearchaeota archaeon]|nr:hypothetical protein [Candidatus Woesearchaeota archaeon]
MRLKKAVSPLIATVLLVMIVVTIGSLMATWVKTYVDQNIAYAEEKTTGPFKCTNEVFFDILTVDNKVQICDNFTSNSSNNTIYFTLENKGTIDLMFNLMLIGNINIDSANLNTTLAIDNIFNYNYTYKNTTGELIQAKISPIITLKNNELFECKNIHITIPESAMLNCPLII